MFRNSQTCPRDRWLSDEEPASHRRFWGGTAELASAARLAYGGSPRRASHLNGQTPLRRRPPSSRLELLGDGLDFVERLPLFLEVLLEEAQAVLALLAAIPANTLAASALAGLPSRRRSCERIAEALARTGNESFSSLRGVPHPSLEAASLIPRWPSRSRVADYVIPFVWEQPH
jgi:hypothetical protein